MSAEDRIINATLAIIASLEAQLNNQRAALIRLVEEKNRQGVAQHGESVTSGT